LDNLLQAAALLESGRVITPEILARLLEGRPARRPERRTAALGPRAEALLGVLGERWLSSPALAERLGVSARTVNRELLRLLRRGLVEAHGEARARVYRRLTGP
jgi:DNA-binding NarL/FixJ family response regulator